MMTVSEKYESYDLDAEQIIDDYTSADCWALALALNKATKYQILVVSQDTEDCNNYCAWVHAGVKLPDGRVLDVEGVHDINDWLNNWEQYFTFGENDEVIAREFTRSELIFNVKDAGIHAYGDMETRSVIVEALLDYVDQF